MLQIGEKVQSLPIHLCDLPSLLRPLHIERRFAMAYCPKVPLECLGCMLPVGHHVLLLQRLSKGSVSHSEPSMENESTYILLVTLPLPLLILVDRFEIDQ